MLWIRLVVRDDHALSSLNRAVSAASTVALAVGDEGVFGKTVVSTIGAHHDRSRRDARIDET